MDQTRDYWRLCSSCRKQIGFEQTYYACSVSTCNQKRTFLSFCSLPCFQEHVPVLRHRDAWAEQKRAPSFERWKREREGSGPEASDAADRRPAATGRVPDVVAAPRAGPSAAAGSAATGSGPDRPVELNDADLPRDILIVASKLKQYIRARSGMNTSDGVMKALSDIIRTLSDQAIRNAAAAERKTVMDRDFDTDKLRLDRS